MLIVEVFRRILLNYVLFFHSIVFYPSIINFVLIFHLKKYQILPFQFEHSSFYQVSSINFVFLLELFIHNKYNKTSSVCYLPFASSSGFDFFNLSVGFNLSLCLCKRLACFLSVSVRSVFALTSPFGLT